MSCAGRWLGVVYSDIDSAVLTARTRATLDHLARALGVEGFDAGCLVGHTDSTASDAYNLDLSRRRVDAVAAYLQAHTRHVRFTTAYVGERQPVVPDRTDSGRATNRCVQIGVG